jgi:hypothetical protein
MTKFHNRQTGIIEDVPSVSEMDQYENYGSLYGHDFKEPTCNGCGMPEAECEALGECNHGKKRKLDNRFD